MTAQIKMSELMSRAWPGTGSAAGILGGVPVSSHCARAGVTALGDKLAYGNGAATDGPVMPFNGRLICATLSGTNVTGSVTYCVMLDGNLSPFYFLGATGTGGKISNIKDFQSSPLEFTAGTQIGWVATAYSITAATGIEVTFYVVFD